MGRCLGGRGALQERKAGQSSRVCLVSPWEWGQKVWRGHGGRFAKEMGMRLVGWTWGDEVGGENLQFPCLPPCSAWPVGPQRMSATFLARVACAFVGS